MKKRALISVSDKTGVVEFAKNLVKNGFEIISTGGTAKALADEGVNVIGISEITGFPECLDGRVKTLHPAVHAGVLAMRDNKEHMEQLQELGINTIDIVAINLYPFKATIAKPNVEFEDAIENIDIGGPTMIRAAAKNWQDVAVIVNPEDYEIVIAEIISGEIRKETKARLARAVFSHTSAYDTMISNWLAKKAGDPLFPDEFSVTYEKVQEMRYGENPHQQAAFYKEIGDTPGSLAKAKQLGGKELSFNNINDTNGALMCLKEFAEPCVVGVKHANPCGVGVADNIYDAYIKAYEADPVSIFGGIVAANREIDGKTAEELVKIFLEIVIAPSFTKEALEILSQKKNLRVLELSDIMAQPPKNDLDMKKVYGGLLVQQLDTSVYEEENFKVVTKRAPSEDELKQLKMAMRVVKHVKSNGVCLVKDNATVGVGPGQTNRITALELAIKYAGEKANGSVMGSDAFFPFSDCVLAAAEAGITAIIQPGGSIRDEDSIKACDENGIAMIFTGERHFKH